MISTGKKLLITGANGFVGSFILREAMKRNFDAYAAVRKGSDLSRIEKLNPKYIYTDFEDEDLLRSQLDENHFDYIIHSAGLTRAAEHANLYKVNSAYLRKILQILIEENRIPKKFVYLSSLAAYGPADLQPDALVSNQSYPHPLTHYGKSKLQAEQFLNNYRSIPHLIFRPTAVYGPGEKDLFISIKGINRGINARIGKFRQLLTFVYVKDLARLLVDSLEAKAVNKSYFVSDGELYNIESFGEIVAEILNKKPINIHVPLKLIRLVTPLIEKLSKFSGNYPALHVDKIAELISQSWNCDTYGIQRDFGFEAEYKLEQGMKETIGWYKDHGWL